MDALPTDLQTCLQDPEKIYESLANTHAQSSSLYEGPIKDLTNELTINQNML